MSNNQGNGSAAAMREALEKAKKAICHHADHICQSLSWENSNLQSNCADVLCAHRELCEAKTEINAALAEPPRNCDIHPKRDEASKAFQETVLTERERERAKQYPLSVMDWFIDWLLAPAAERKGEGK